MLTMRPQPASIMSGNTAWVVWKTPLRLTSITRCQSSNVMLLNFLKPSRPAAFTSTVTGPSWARMADSAASTCDRSVTSAVKASSASDGRRSMEATFKPSARNRSTTASPMPDPPPVTTAVFISGLCSEGRHFSHKESPLQL